MERTFLSAAFDFVFDFAFASGLSAHHRKGRSALPRPLRKSLNKWIDSIKLQSRAMQDVQGKTASLPVQSDFHKNLPMTTPIAP
jgi:hypothetical protein